jgi:hypothetical protein
MSSEVCAQLVIWVGQAVDHKLGLFVSLEVCAQLVVWIGQAVNHEFGLFFFEIIISHSFKWVLEVVLCPPSFPFSLGSKVGDFSGSFAERFHSHENSNESLEIWAVLELRFDGLSELIESFPEFSPGVGINIILEFSEHALERFLVEGKFLESSLVSGHW